jgi:hypothetical protein
VNHGFGSAPTGIWVVPQDDLSVAGSDFYIDYTSITATQFTLYLTAVDIGADHVFRFFCNKLYTEGNCTVVAGTASIVVNHGFGLGPTNIWVVPKQDMLGRSYWIDYTTITATQFTLYITTNDPFTAFSFRFFCGASATMILGTEIQDYYVGVAEDGFQEEKGIITSEWNAWDTTNSKVVRKVKIHGCTRVWTLKCVEYGVDWVNSKVKAIQELVDDDAASDFIVSMGTLHEVDTHVKVLSCELVYPEGSHVGSRERQYVLRLQEVT